ncbi:MAG: EAL domain-containing protein [Cyanobacteria bacterium J06627_32]
MALKILRRLLGSTAAPVQHRLLEKQFNNTSRDCTQVRAIAFSSATAIFLIVLSNMGLFQPMETKAFDLLTRLAAKYEHTSAPGAAFSNRSTAERLIVVAITEEDIQDQKQWPLSDQVFAQLLSKLQQHSPRVIGLDIYRDVPHAPGTEALAKALQKENVITITNLDSLGEVEVPSPLQVPDSRVGFNDFVVDPDGVIRRNFMFAALGDRELYSFSLRLVDQFLKSPAHQLTAEADALRIGTLRLSSITPDMGGYQKIDADGYQTLGRYILPENVARQVSLSQVLDGDFDPTWITGNIVVIGTTAPSQKDLYYTPFSAEGSNDLLMSGVVLHAQMTQQLLSAVLEGRALLRGFPQWGEFAWVWCWGMVGGLIAWRFTHPGTLAIATGAGLLGLTTIALGLFSVSVWAPVVLPMATFSTTVATIIVYREFRKSFYDSLTGLPNRALLTQELQRMLRKPNQSPISVILLDIDRFKVFNENFGLRVGDQLLQMMARRLRQNVPAKAKIARIAGDEFVVLLGWLSRREEALSLAEKLNQKMAEPIEIRGQKLFPTISTGIAFSPSSTDAHHALNAGDLLRDAQTAMSRAKSQGRGHCEIFVQDMRAHLSTRLGLEADLREALQKQELLLYYQPIVCLKTMKLAGFEALIRWQHPERGMISPAQFIPIAEDTGLIIPIGQWVLEVACLQTKKWQQQFPVASPFISVNLSGRQFAQKDLVEQIGQTLTEIGFDPAKLKLELTESVVMDDVEASIDVLLRLKALRLQLGIDDFGTGYSSLSYLHRFPIDTLKVDRSFVMEMESPNGTAELVKTIVSLGHNLGMTVVAEGIETESQSRQLQALQCEYGQGYLFARPLPPEAAESLLHNASVWNHNAA